MNTVSRWKRRRWILRPVALVLCCTALPFAAGTLYAVPSAATEAASSTAPAIAPIPLAEIPTQADSAGAALEDLRSEISTDQAVGRIESELPVLTRELNARLKENARVMRSRPSLDRLRHMERSWKHADQTLDDWRQDLIRRMNVLDKQGNSLDQLQHTWQATADSRSAQQAPADLRQTVDRILAAVPPLDANIDKQRHAVLSLQSRIVEQTAHIDRVLAMISRAREETLNHLFYQDSPPIVALQMRSEWNRSLGNDVGDSFGTQTSLFVAYAQRSGGRFVFQIALFFAFAGVFFALRRHCATMPPAIDAKSARIFNAPISAAAVVALALTGFIYPHAPHLLRSIAGLVALVPAVLLLRDLFEPSFFATLYTLAFFYALDQTRSLLEGIPLLFRTLYLVEMALAAIFVLWFKRAEIRLKAKDRGRVLPWLEWLIFAGFSGAFAANAFGYLNLATLLGEALLNSIYVAVIMDALLRVADASVELFLRSAVANRFELFSQHAAVWKKRVHTLVLWLAIFCWINVVLERLAIRDKVVDSLKDVLGAPLRLGSMEFSAGGIFAFLLTLVAAIGLSRIVRFVLSEEVFPRFNLRHGLPYAINTLLHYVVLSVGFLLALGALGVDMTKFTILAGAVGVGLGFGTQNIVNNFVSGLILLFERPIRVGDAIQVADATGVVEHIGIRATHIRTANDSRVVIPNGNLISNQVTNWSLAEGLRIVDIPVSVSGTDDPRKVTDLLSSVAAAHPWVSKNPPPNVFVEKINPGGMDLQLRVWTSQTHEMLRLRSDLSIAIHDALARQNLSVK